MSKKQSMVVVGVTYVISMVVGLLVYRYFRNMGEEILIATIIADVVMTLLVFIGSLVINNSSLYDPYWSVIPPVIVVLWMIDLNLFELNFVIVLIGILIWAIRLTRNWYIDFKGFSQEDFRYVDFRNRFKGFYWMISLLGIHLFPTLIVLLGLYPVLFLLQNEAIIQSVVYLGTTLMISGAYISFVSDEQRRAFKLEHPQKTITTGLWKYSRHPNYFGEVLFWFGVYVASLSAGFDFISVLGIVGMLLLFNGYSVPKMEQRLLHNKSDYQDVMKQVPRFFIRWW